MLIACKRENALIMLFFKRNTYGIWLWIAVHHPNSSCFTRCTTHTVFIRQNRAVFVRSANFETLTPKLFSFFAFVNLHSRERTHIPNPFASLDARIKLIYSVYRRCSLDFSCDVARAPIDLSAYRKKKIPYGISRKKNESHVVSRWVAAEGGSR